MNYSLCADIMFVAVGEKGPIWPDTDGILAAMEFAKENGLNGIEMFSLEGRDLKRILETSKELNIPISACVSEGASFLGDPEKTKEYLLTHPIDADTYHKTLRKCLESYRISDEDKKWIRNVEFPVLKK